MKKTGLIKLLVGITLAASGAFAIGSALNSKKSEAVDAASASGSIFIQKNDNDMKYTGSKLVGYFYDNNSHNAWGDAVWNTGNTYQEYSWSLSFSPTTIILLRVNGNAWDSNDPWNNVWCRTGDVSLTNVDVLWMAGDATQYNDHWGTYSMETFVMSSSNSQIAELSEKKIKLDHEGLEVFGEVSLSANQEFYIKKTCDGDAKYSSYTCLDLIASNLSKAGDYIKVTNAATYEFYFNFNANTLYLTDPVVAGADEWAQNFLEHVGCDETGATEPSGWAGEVSRYNAITDGRIKDRIYSASANKNGSTLEIAVYWYDYAITVHPSLTRFIKNSSNVVRGSNNSISRTPFAITENSNTITIIVIVSLVSVTAIGGYFFIKRREEN